MHQTAILLDCRRIFYLDDLVETIRRVITVEALGQTDRAAVCLMLSIIPFWNLLEQRFTA